MTWFEAVNPAALGDHRGFSHGLLAPPGGRLLFVAGQIAEPAARGATFLVEFESALARVLTVVREAGGSPEHVARLTVYLLSMERYLAARPRLHEPWRRHMGDHDPAMAVVEVQGLVNQDATIEIEATAVLA